MFRSLSLLLLSSVLAFAADAPNTLTEQEKADGWRLLFDGSTTKGWRSLNKPAFPDQWQVAEGELRLVKNDGAAGGDIVTEEKFGDFELTWEWKISVGGNSGLKYNLPDPKKNVGCEYQMLDDERHPDAKVRDGEHRTGALYDLIPPPADKIYHPAGEWNQSRILVKGNHVEQYLNGAKTVEFDFGSDALKELIAKSKFKTTPGWGVKTESPLLLQDHGNNVAVRSMKLRVPKP